ncbi:MAG: creatininase family protein [Candidatus Bathyarchaeota archaeon]|nr:creatininase family protein [Candidatus Bathyarchaeota archaeon]MDH5745345.1 creatininase family protein [Candidatus Bathyarchaeota archaeon]
MKKVYLPDMRWPEAEKAFEETDIAILAVGAIEQHGPHLPLAVDHIHASGIARRVAEKAGVILAPYIQFGYCPWNSDFPGNISIRYNVLANLVKDVCHSLIRHGTQKILIINGHGGNTGPLSLAARQLKEETGAFFVISDWWTVMTEFARKEHKGHGGSHGVSLLLALTPDRSDLVDLNEAKKLQPIKPLSNNIIPKNESKSIFKSCTVEIPINTREISENGSLATEPPIYATRQEGEKILEIVVNYFVDLINEMRTL